MSPERRRPGLRDLLFAGYVACCIGALTWPGYAWLGNHVEPFVLGVPFSFAWVIGWVLASLVALVLYHVTDRDRREEG